MLLMKHAPLLEEVNLKLVQFDDIYDTTIFYHEAGFEPRVKRPLRSITLQDLQYQYLEPFLRHCPLPSESLIISNDCTEVYAENWNDELAPILEDRLGGLSLVHLTIEAWGPVEFQLSEENNHIEGRCSVSLRIRDWAPYSTVYEECDPSGFNLPHLSVITLMSIWNADSGPALCAMASSVTARNPTVTKLEVCERTLVANHVATFPNLREVCVSYVDLQATNVPFNELLEGLRLRNAPISDGTVLPPLQKLVLYRCKNLQDSLATLQELVDEVVVETDDKGRWWGWHPLSIKSNSSR